MSKFTRDVLRISAEIRKDMQERLQKELIEEDKYIQQIRQVAKEESKEE